MMEPSIFFRTWVSRLAASSHLTKPSCVPPLCLWAFSLLSLIFPSAISHGTQTHPCKNSPRFSGGGVPLLLPPLWDPLPFAYEHLKKKRTVIYHSLSSEPSLEPGMKTVFGKRLLDSTACLGQMSSVLRSMCVLSPVPSCQLRAASPDSAGGGSS